MLDDGHVYYSPNCQDTVPVPSSLIPEDLFVPKASRYGHRNIFDLDISQYTSPRWWIQAFGWISFLPLRPDFENPVFEPLLATPRRACLIEGGCYALPKHIAGSWFNLEESLSKVSSLLQSHYGSPGVRPSHPWAFGYYKSRQKESDVMKSARKAKDWFAVWMALVSFAIAWAEVEQIRLQGYPQLAKINWYDFLIGQGIEHTWVDALISSTVCSFDLATPRSGIFLHLGAGNGSQPSVEFFYRFGVPVWYPWGKDQASNAKWAHIAPLAYQLQLGTTSITRAPRPIFKVSEAILQCSGGEDRLADTGSALNKTPSPTIQAANIWEFFARRKEINQRSLQTETSMDRHRRLQRERQPPTASAKVFRWIRDIHTGQLLREMVSAKWRLGTLDDYGGGQKRYDSFSNEWDCASEFGSDDGYDSSDQDDHDIFSNFDEAAHESSKPELIISTESTPNPHEHDQDWLPESSSAAYVPTADAFEEEIIEILQTYFGYAPPIPAPDSPSCQAVAKQKNFLRLMGFPQDDRAEYQRQIFLRPRILAGIDFMRRLHSNTSTLSDEWDISRPNRAYVGFNHRFSALRELPGLLYMFDFKDRRTVKWNLTMTTAAHAIMVCRLDPQLSEADLALYLARRGIPFRTLQKADTLVHLKEGPTRNLSAIPKRPPKYIFTMKDYTAYLEQRLVILRGPRSRVALMKGGYIWRTSITTVSLDTVLLGPSGLSDNPEHFFVVRLPQTGEEYVDDELTGTEMDLLCGLYTCYTGMYMDIDHKFALT